MRRFRAPALLCLAAAFLAVLPAYAPANAQEPALLGLGVGQFDQGIFDPELGFLDVSDNDSKNEALDLRLEYRFATPLATLFGGRAALRPFAGIEATSDGAVYGLGGLVLDLRFDSLYVAPSFGAGLFLDGNGKDMGSPLEFRSQIELGWIFEGGYRLGLAYSHISNAGLDSVNPGANTIGLYLHAPVAALFPD